MMLSRAEKGDGVLVNMLMKASQGQHQHPSLGLTSQPGISVCSRFHPPIKAFKFSLKPTEQRIH